MDIVGDTANFDIAGTDSSVAIGTDELKHLTTAEPRLVVYGDGLWLLGDATAPRALLPGLHATCGLKVDGVLAGQIPGAVNG